MGKNILCRFIGHKFGEWEYVAENSCEQVRTCKRDGYEERYTTHQFGDWQYVALDSCEQVRVCKRDGYEERRTTHQFGDWQNIYVDDNSCVQVRVCTRDGYEERAEGSHQWEIIDEYSGYKTIRYEEAGRPDEELYSTMVSVDYTLLKCRRCGRQETEES